jgi:hypothetical protein
MIRNGFRERERESKKERTLEVIFLLSKGYIACGEKKEKHFQVPYLKLPTNVYFLTSGLLRVKFRIQKATQN